MNNTMKFDIYIYISITQMVSEYTLIHNSDMNVSTFHVKHREILILATHIVVIFHSVIPWLVITVYMWYQK